MANVFRSCVIARCDYKQRTEKRKIFSLPKDEETLRKWCLNLGITVEDSKKKHLYVCSNHFGKNEFTAKKVKPGILPTYNLGHEPIELSRPLPIPKIRYRTCCFNHCTNTSKTCTCFKFPNDKNKMKVWCDIVGIPSGRNRFICEAHFKYELIKNKKLHIDAYPTEYLTKMEMEPAEDQSMDEFELFSDLHEQDEKKHILPYEELDDIPSTSTNNSAVAMRIEQLEQELAEAKKTIEDLRKQLDLQLKADSMENKSTQTNLLR